jgi:transcription antitermination factor NusG
MSASWVNTLSTSFPEANVGSERWFAVYTCANHEKQVEKQFKVRQLNHFLPLYGSVRRWKDRRVRLQMPLFPGYIFARFRFDERLRILQVPGVVRIIGFDGRPYPLPEHEIEKLRLGMSHGLAIEPHPYLKAGCRVRIIHGPLQGTQGILVRTKNTHRVVLSLDLISRSAAVEVEASDIERVS